MISDITGESSNDNISNTAVSEVVKLFSVLSVTVNIIKLEPIHSLSKGTTVTVLPLKLTSRSSAPFTLYATSSAS